MPHRSNPVNDVEWLKHPIFIVGLQKSGTTMVRNLLDGATAAVVVPEETALFHPDFQKLLHELVDGADAASDLAQRVASLVMSNTPLSRIRKSRAENTVDGLIDYSDVDDVVFEQTVANRLRESGSISTRSILLSIVMAVRETIPTYRSRPDPKCWVEKPPSSFRRVKFLARWFPASRFIHLVRDPRDNYVSLARKWAGGTVDVVARKWRAAIRTAGSNRILVGPDRYLPIRYKDIVSNPRDVMKQVCNFAGIEFSDEVVKPTTLGRTWLGNSMFEGVEGPRIYSKSLGRFREPSHAEHNRRMETLLGRSALQEWGYEPLNDLTAVEQSKGAVARLVFSLQDLKRDLRRPDRPL